MGKKLRVRFSIYIAIGVLAWGGWSLWVEQKARAAIDPAVRAAMEQSGSADITILFDFNPERTHVDIFQEYGSIVEVDDGMVALLRVRADDIRHIARYYWVSGIAPLER